MSPAKPDYYPHMNHALLDAARLRRLVLPGLCAALIALPALAQQSAAPTPSPSTANDDILELSPFTVSTSSQDRYRTGDAISAVRVRASLIDTPSSISVITRDMMNDLAPNRVFDVARYVAGVQEGRGIQFQDRLIIRGFETQNGARTVDNFLQSADADNIEEAVIDRIEVTKGPNAILSPAGAPGGSLNIITKSPLYQQQGSLSAQVGLFASQKATLDVGGPLAPGSRFAYRLVGSGQDTGLYWDDDAKMRSWSAAPMISWRISDKSMLTVKLISAQHWIFREPLLILDPSTTATSGDPKLLPGIDPSGLNGIQPWSNVGTRSDDLFAVYTSSLNEHLDLRIAGNGRKYHEDSDQNFLSTPGLSNRYNVMTGELTQDYTWALQNTALPYNASSNPYVAKYDPWINPTNIPNRGDIQDTTRKTANLQADLAANFKFGDVSSQTILGAAYARQYAYNKTKSANLPGINLLNHVSAYPAYPATWTAVNGSSYTNQQLYVSERLGFINDRLYVTGGLLNYYSRQKNWNGLTGLRTGKLDDDKNMWSAGALFKFTDTLSVYYSHSNNGNPVIVNQTQALWRDGVQDEFGVKTDFFDKRLSLNAAYFEISQTNVTVPNPAYQTDPTQPQTLISDLSNKGFELELMGRLTPNLSVITTYSHLKMRDALSRRVRAVADNNAAVLLNYRFLDGAAKNLSLSLGVTYSGKRAGDVPDGNFTQLNVVKQVSFYLKPQYLTTFVANYRVNRNWSFQGNVDNILNDHDYISVAGGRITGTGLTTQPGINFRLTTRYDF
jgi:iron complex outermembrane receptor protein